MPQTVRRRWMFIPAYLAAHMFLDWISFIHAVSSINITPWNPPAGLMMGLSVLLGLRAVPLVWLGLTAADIVVRDLPVALGTALLANGIVALGYGAAGGVLRKIIDPGLSSLRDIVLLLGGSAAAVLVIGLGFIAVHTAAGLFDWARFPEVLLRFWTGEIIGIAVLTPMVLMARRMPSLRWSWGGAAEILAQGALIGFTLWLDFGPLASSQYEHFYLLFLPAIAVAVRHGLGGAVLASAATQTGLIAAIQVAGVDTARMAHFQLLMLTLAITILLLGAVVSERRRVEDRLRARQSDLAHASRLIEAGEMAAALAHELNQPLAATMGYARAARKIARLEEASPRLTEILDKTVTQAERADRVIRSLRDFVRKGARDRTPLPVATLIADCLTLAGPLASRHAVEIAAEVALALPAIAGDAVQLQQAILNLVRNAAEAMTPDGTRPEEQPGRAQTGRRRIVIFACPAAQPGFVSIGVRDTGPGLAEVVERNLFAPFVTTKPTGMGLGLSIVRTIVESHGGTLTARSGNRGGSGAANGAEGGTVFQFTIPVHAKDREGEPA
ncbi:ATP-binding protein [Azospirillum sp. BE72]|uniref:ATP-binding protein n=1 Tax=Azospirillum sp. BE72 TaxID=2817776 RepID=UPI00285F2313|nr:ATP-binding protein [Azospirillum sp. BE72]MDR6772433.1 signal transduction histidine kinase [Azospirillum sp. BE72]